MVLVVVVVVCCWCSTSTCMCLFSPQKIYTMLLTIIYLVHAVTWNRRWSKATILLVFLRIFFFFFCCVRVVSAVGIINKKKRSILISFKIVLWIPRAVRCIGVYGWNSYARSENRRLRGNSIACLNREKNHVLLVK